MGSKIIGWTLILVPGGIIAFGVFQGLLMALATNDWLAEPETSTVLMIGAVVAVLALLPMGIGVVLVQRGGGAPRELRLLGGWALVVFPVIHLVLLLLSGLAYYADPPWSVPAGEAGGFLTGTGVLTLFAAIPIVTGVKLLRDRILVPRTGTPRELGSSGSDDEQLLPR